MVYLFCFLFAVLLAGIIFGVVVEQRNRKTLLEVATELGFQFQEIKASGFTRPFQGKWDGIQLCFEAADAGHRSSRHTRMRWTVEISSAAYVLIQNRLEKWEPNTSPVINPITKNTHDCFVQSDNPLFAWGILNDANCQSLLVQALQSSDDELRIVHNKMILDHRINLAGPSYRNIPELRNLFKQDLDLIKSLLSVIRRMTIRANALEDPDTICPFCRVALEKTMQLIICSACGSWHHDSCWREHGRCSIFGCTGSAIIGLSRT